MIWENVFQPREGRIKPDINVPKITLAKIRECSIPSKLEQQSMIHKYIFAIM